MKTVVGLFNSTAEAQQIKQTLISQGYEASGIKVVANESDDDYSYDTRSETTGERAAGSAEGIGHKIANFFSSLTGGDDDAHHHYASGVNQGGALLTVRTDDDRASEVAALLQRSGARQIEGDATGGETSYGMANTEAAYGSGTNGQAFTGQNLTGEAPAGETAIPVVEEELVVGKREVDRGGVRVYSHVVERPVSADVTLHDERVNVERRTVDRPATAADFSAGDASYELRASGEEAVVGKTSRVVEEVLIGKQGSEHTEAVHDTVRKTEVDVEQIPAETIEKNRL